MNKQKLSLAAIQDKLSRNEMKQIMAGLEQVPPPGGGGCDHYHVLCGNGAKACINSCYNAPSFCADKGGEVSCI